MREEEVVVTDARLTDNATHVNLLWRFRIRWLFITHTYKQLIIMPRSRIGLIVGR
jgi:hypothetical protein